MAASISAFHTLPTSWSGSEKRERGCGQRTGYCYWRSGKTGGLKEIQIEVQIHVVNMKNGMQTHAAPKTDERIGMDFPRLFTCHAVKQSLPSMKGKSSGAANMRQMLNLSHFPLTVNLGFLFTHMVFFKDTQSS